MGDDTLALCVDRLVFNVAIGNCDAHGKNYSLLHTTEGTRLAPRHTISFDILPAVKDEDSYFLLPSPAHAAAPQASTVCPTAAASIPR